MTISENGDKDCFENWELCLFDNSRFMTTEWYKARITALALPIRVLRLAFRHSWTQTQDTWTSLPASVSLHSLVIRTDQGFLKDEVPQFWPCLFSFRRCHMHLQSSQSYLMRAGGQILRKKAEPNHQRIAYDWFCNFQSWHTHQLGCICRSNSCKQWKGEVTKRSIAGVQRPHGTALIACHLPEHKPPVCSRMT